jgi:hypothetical protein
MVSLQRSNGQRDVQALRRKENNRVHHDLGYTAPSTKGGTDHVTVYGIAIFPPILLTCWI